MTRKLVLASRSPRRREILTAAGLAFDVRVPDVPEIRQPDEPPGPYVKRLAQAKARAVSVSPSEIILSADTVVVRDEHVLEKPLNSADAARMLALLAGREHQVMTGFCLRTDSQETIDLAISRVWFSPMTDAEIAEYVASGEPLDKAGAYAIQGRASKFVWRVEGCYFNIVGLPIGLVYRRLKELT